MTAEIERLREARPADDLIRPIPSWEFERPPPEREWMVEGCFPKGTVAMLSGDGGIGKSLLCMQLATAAVMGRQWLGMRCQRGNALMLACEDDGDELNRRQRPILRALDIDYADLEGGLHLVPRVGCDNTLCRLDKKDWTVKPTPLCSRMLQYCLQHGITYPIIDTATQTLAINQNDEMQIMQAVNVLRRMAVALQGCVILTMKSNYSRKLEKLRLKYNRGVFIVDAPEPVRHWLDRED